MDNVNWLKFKHLNQKSANTQSADSVNNTANSQNNTKNLVQQTQRNIINNYQRDLINPQTLKMNNLASIDRAVYVKEILNLPKTMVELLAMVQKEDGEVLNAKNNQNLSQNKSVQNQINTQIETNQSKQVLQNQKEFQAETNQQKQVLQNPKDVSKNQVSSQNQNNISKNFDNKIAQNQEFVQNKSDKFQEKVFNENSKVLNQNVKNQNNFINTSKNQIQRNTILNMNNQLHNEVRNNIRNQIINPQILNDSNSLEQLQSSLNKTTQQTSEDAAKYRQQLASQLGENVSISQISALLQKNGKLAITKMVSMMAMVSNQGLGDVTPLKDTMNIINASVSANSKNETAQIIKNLILLYLPWLPLNEGVGFDLEVEQDDEKPLSESFIRVFITMVNYGNLSAVISLLTANSVDIQITCSQIFPKNELLQRLLKESNQHSMSADIDFKYQQSQKEVLNENPKAKVNLSNTNQMNPYLLLMTHSLIRHAIEIDSNLTLGNANIKKN